MIEKIKNICLNNTIEIPEKYRVKYMEENFENILCYYDYNVGFYFSYFQKDNKLYRISANAENRGLRFYEGKSISEVIFLGENNTKYNNLDPESLPEIVLEFIDDFENIYKESKALRMRGVFS